MKKNIFAGLVGLFMVLLFTECGDAPTVFKDRKGNICGCMLGDEPADLIQCDFVGEVYDVIHVSHCKGDK